MNTTSRSNALIALLTVGSVIAVALLIAVSWDRQATEDSLIELYEFAAHPKRGVYVPIYETETLAGAPVQLGAVPEGRRQLLYFFTTTCPYCRASIPRWSALSEIAAGDSVDVYGVALDSTHLVEAYRTELGLPYPVVAMDDQRFARLFRVNGVPLTMVVEPTGLVAYVKSGEFSSSVLVDSVVTALGAPLLGSRDGTPRVPSLDGGSTPSND